eukprot:7378312-Prymnesium_polylepis.2
MIIQHPSPEPHSTAARSHFAPRGGLPSLGSIPLGGSSLPGRYCAARATQDIHTHETGGSHTTATCANCICANAAHLFACEPDSQACVRNPSVIRFGLHTGSHTTRASPAAAHAQKADQIAPHGAADSSKAAAGSLGRLDPAASRAHVPTLHPSFDLAQRALYVFLARGPRWSCSKAPPNLGRLHARRSRGPWCRSYVQ